MITKTDKTKEVNGLIKPIYLNTLTGREGTLQEMTFIPSQRKDRKSLKSKSIVRTNRKSTKGRRIYMQEIKVDNKVVKTIKHIQETPDAINRKIAYNDMLAKIELDAKKYDKTKKD